MAFCTKCGTSLPEGAGFCPSCGAKNDYQPVAPAAEPVFQQPVAEPIGETELLNEQPPVVEQPPVAEAQPVYEQPPVQEPVYQQPVYQQPSYSYQQPVYQQPVAEAQLEVSTGSKVMGFIGMGLGIMALVMGSLALIMSFAGFDDIDMAVMAISYGIIGLIAGIPGKILSAKATAGGFVGTPTKLGSIFSLIGIILSGVAFTFGIIGSAM